MAHQMQSDSYIFTDITTKEVKPSVEEFDLCHRSLKHGLPNGTCNITGPHVNLDLVKHGGIVYPACGEIGGKAFPRRSLTECQVAFADTGLGFSFSDN